MSPAVERDVTAAITAAGFEPRSMREISTIRSPTLERYAFRVDLVGGTIIKARHLGRPELAGRLLDLRRNLPEAFVPAIAAHGPVLLERWVEGHIIGPARPGDAHVRDAAVLFASLHTTPPADGSPVGVRTETRRWREAAECAIDALAGAGTLTPPDAAALRELLTTGDPGSAVVGLVHLDFCGENMLIDGDGHLRLFDNDRIDVDAIGFDMGRAWYRWDLAPDDWSRFERAYAAGGGLTEALATLDFWGTVAAAKSAALRLAADPDRIGVPVERLHRIAAARGCGGVS